ncbi:MAG: L,D-transpeptidase family protein [Halioglobus sp.]
MKQVLRLFCLCSALLAFVVRADVSSEILTINESLFVDRQDQRALNRGAVHQPEFVGIFYELIDYQTAWKDADYVGEMIAVLGDSTLEGLNPEDYHYSELMALRREYLQDWADEDYVHAQFDILLTDGILLYARHLLEGKVDPRTLDSSWNYTRRDFVPDTVANSLVDAIREHRVAEVMEQLKPQAPMYRKMKSELKRYRHLAETQSFFKVPSDSVLKPGQTKPGVVLLRRRLKQLDYVDANSPESEYFDKDLERAVRQFQQDHSIDSDGIVGRQSFEVLNMSFQERVAKLRVNMDRLRWISQDVSDDFILVNIAGYELHYFRNRELIWETAVMTGAINTRTPIFQKRLRYIEFNPTWTPPRSIINRSLFAKFKANPGYAAEKNYKFYDSKGKEVDALSIDWGRYTGLTLPYRVVQMPGPYNAMGQVKFMFPNRHAVYLHDTPSKELFSRTSRAFSAGCIRVKQPLKLAGILLDDPEQWSASNIDAVLASGKPKQVVHLQRNIDVLLMYWTVSPTTSGRIQFHPDIYQLDGIALEALDKPAQLVDVS